MTMILDITRRVGLNIDLRDTRYYEEDDWRDAVSITRKTWENTIINVSECLSLYSSLAIRNVANSRLPFS